MYELMIAAGAFVAGGFLTLVVFLFGRDMG
jgi:hypothetical protein